ncbi:MAG: TRAP transporter small permease [Desulfobacula sp.]|nr:TRAP transporter small permease [Desulfobacula sp.]
MNVLTGFLHRISRAGGFIGGVFLIAAMLLLLSNIVGRITHTVIPGSYELFEMLMVVPVSFALFYAAKEKYHVVVELIISQFPPRLAAVAEMTAALLSFAIWSLIVWASVQLAAENGLSEATEILELPYLPFRMAWIFFLSLFCLTCLLDFFQACRRYCEK